MKIYRIATFIVSCLFLFGNMNAQTTQRLSATKANEYGIVYSLPTTWIDITIETEHAKYTPGEFYNYARRHLAINDAITEQLNTVKVKSIVINTRGEANSSEKWLVQFKGGEGTSMLLSADGIPLTICSDSVATVKKAELPVAVVAQPTVLETPAARHAMTQEMIRSSSMSKRAELAAQRIFELRDMRNDLLSGELENAPADGKAMQLVLDNIDGQESALTAMFAGTKQTWTSVRTMTIYPDTLGMNGEVIARISPIDGILDADNLAGAPLRVSVDILERGELPLNEKGELVTFPKGGVAYTIPGRALVTVSYEGETLLSTEVLLAQFGCTFGLDPRLFTNKKAPSMMQFDSTTGAVLYVGHAN